MRTILIGLLMAFTYNCSQPMRNTQYDDCDEECQRAVQEEVEELTRQYSAPHPPPQRPPENSEPDPEPDTAEQPESPTKTETHKRNQKPHAQRNRSGQHVVRERRRVRVVKRERWLPCFMNRPYNVPEGDMLILNNRMDHPLGIKVNGTRLKIIEVGLYNEPQTNWENTHHGLLPTEHQCWLIMKNPRQTQRVTAVMFRYNHYRRTLHYAGKSIKHLDIRWPRRGSFRLTYNRHTWRY